MMRKQIFKFIMVICLLFGFASSVCADTTTNDETEYTVSVSARHNNRALSYVTVMISQNGETITYATTNRSGNVSFSLVNGDYTATIGYVSGNYSYYGTTDFTVDGSNMNVTVNVDSQFDPAAAKRIYDNTTYFNHVDIRVNGTFTVGPSGELVTHAITLKNVELLVKDGSNTIIDTKFTNNNETYEWRVTNKRIPKSAVVSLVFDIVLDGEVVREGYVYSFSGEEEFIQAIINCDMNQGLDFIIDPTEIVAAALYDVSYVWTGLPQGLAHVPHTSEHAPDYVYPIDTQFKVGDVVIDEVNNKKYTFNGWEEWSNATDSHANKNDIGSNTTITITNDTIIYGVWTVEDLTPTSNHLILKKTFNGNDGRMPEDLFFRVTDLTTGTIYEVDFHMFTWDANNSVYVYNLPIYSVGNYKIEELNYNILGYDFDTTNSTEVIQNVSSDLTQEVTVSFNNNYIKRVGNAFHNSGFIVEKASAKDSSKLSGAVFTLYDGNDNVIATSTTDESGYAMFMHLVEGTYTLKETSAPSGYFLDETEYRVVVTCTNSYEVYSANQNAYLMQYEYSVVIIPDDHYNGNGNRLTVFNEKIYGSITISKEFGNNSAYNKNNYTGDIKVLVTGNNYSKTVILNKINDFKVTLEDLELGEYTIVEDTNSVKIDGYTLNTMYSKNGIVLTGDNYNQELVITNTYTKIPEHIHNETSFSVKKTDKDGNKLSGAVFGLYDQDGELVTSKTTDNTGLINFEGFKNEGTYTLKEISAPENYNKVDTEWIVKVSKVSGDPVLVNGDYVYNYVVTIEDNNYANGILTVVNEIKTGSITVKKDVTVISGEEVIEKPDDVKDVKYSFTVTIGNDRYDIELADGESMVFDDVPFGTNYSIVENIPTDATWTANLSENANGVLLEDNATVTVENIYVISVGTGGELEVDDSNNNNNVPQTGINNSVYNYIIMMVLGILGLGITVRQYKKEN